MRGIRDDKLRELVDLAKESGFCAVIGGSMHIKLFAPDGHYVTSCTTTYTSSRSYYEVRSKLRRAGLKT